MPLPLDTISTNKLIKTLARRCDGLVVIMWCPGISKVDRDDQDMRVHAFNNHYDADGTPGAVAGSALSLLLTSQAQLRIEQHLIDEIMGPDDDEQHDPARNGA